MILFSYDRKRIVDIGRSDYWKCFVSTIIYNIPDSLDKYLEAMNFLKTGKCKHQDGYFIGRQINSIRDELAGFKPENVIYDIEDTTQNPPWSRNLSPVITSCANYFITADGKDLIFEIVGLLQYSEIMEVDIGVDD